jgi:uncharacterized membrane protein
MSGELRVILFLHVLAAMVMTGAVVAVLTLVVRARRADDLADARTTLANAFLLHRRFVLPGAALSGVIGLLLTLLYSQAGVFAFGRQGWLHASIVLWLVVNATAGFLLARLRRAQDAATGSDGLGGVQTALASGGTGALLWLTALTTLALVFLMVVQPFTRA